MKIRTIHGYDFFEVSSAMQKAIRRGDARVAGFFALELWHSNYRDYVWKRLYTISAEDCYGLITAEIEALWQGHELVNKNLNKNKTAPKGRIFVSKAVLLLCECRKCRDADHLQNLVYDRNDVDVERWIDDVRAFPIEIPPYTYDVHTQKGKKRGRTKEEFFREEYEALRPSVPGLFDDLVPPYQNNLFGGSDPQSGPL
jgi:replication-associated recombination protein RarA